MDDVKIKKKSNGITIVYKIKKTQQISSRYWEILKGQSIRGLLPVELTSGLGGRSLKYFVSDSISLADYLRSNISFSEFIYMIKRFIKVFQDCEASGLRVSHLDLVPERVFLDDNKNVKMIYRPMVVLDDYFDIQAFLKEIGTLYAPGSSASYKDEYLKLLSGSGKFDLFWFQEDISNLGQKWSNNGSGRIKTDVSTYTPPQKAAPLGNSQDRTAAFKDHFNKTIDMPRRRNRATSQLQLFSLKTGEQVSVSSFPFSIGSGEGLCNYVIRSNQYVSTHHAVIEQKGTMFYVKDTNSRNGTLLNDEELEPQKSYEINSGDVLEFADEKFQIL